MLHTLAIANYRSIRELTLSLAPLNVVVGANGVGKSSLYRALRLLSDAASGRLIGSLAAEGGLASTLWAGPEKISRAMLEGRQPVQGGPRQRPVSLRLGFGSDDLGYAIDLGLPQVGRSAFALDPEIKREGVWVGPLLRRSALTVDRDRRCVRVRGEAHEWIDVTTQIPSYESVLTHVADPRAAPELLMLRDRVRSWRFYDHFRTDAQAAARRPQVGTRTPVLAHDGSDLAAALQTTREVGDAEAVDQAIADAFPGAEIMVSSEDGMFRVSMQQPGMLRPLSAAELSDGTLRYLMWTAALLTPRPPELMVLNEPETSLHADLLPALARLIARAAAHSQVWVVTHSRALAEALAVAPDCSLIELEKELGQTRVVGQDLLNTPRWEWPSR